MAFTDLQLKVASEAAVIGAERYIAPIRVFTHDFSPAANVKFGSVAVPVFALGDAAPFAENDNNFCTGDTPDGVVITLDKYFIKQTKLTDLQNATTDINFLRDSTTAITIKLAKAIEADIAATLSGATDASEEALAGDDILEKVASVHEAAAENGVDPYSSVLVVAADVYGKLLAKTPYAMYGSDEAVRYGVITGLFGVRNIIQMPSLPSGSAYLIQDDVLGIASRVVRPVFDGYMGQWDVTDDKSGLTFGFRATQNLCNGFGTVAGTALWGTKLLQPAKLLKLTGLNA